jgi:hypothetical protein
MVAHHTCHVSCGFSPAGKDYGVVRLQCTELQTPQKVVTILCCHARNDSPLARLPRDVLHIVIRSLGKACFEVPIYDSQLEPLDL